MHGQALKAAVAFHVWNSHCHEDTHSMFHFELIFMVFMFKHMKLQGANPSVEKVLLIISIAMSAEKHGTIALGQQYFIEVEATGKKWTVPASLLHESHTEGEGVSETKWLQTSATTYGLCNILNKGSVGRIPSLKNAPGYIELQARVESTIQALQTPSIDSDLFDGQGKNKKAKIALPNQFEVDLGEYGNLVVKAPSKAREDVKILLTASNLDVFVNFMIGTGAQCTEPERRPYQSTGKYAKGS